MAQGKARYVRNVSVTYLERTLSGEGTFKKFGDQGGNGRALASGQGDVGKKWMAFQSFDDRGDSVMATDSKVVSLGNIVGQDDTRTLADA